jgi:uncharacterized protein (TIGR03435 family)
MRLIAALAVSAIAVAGQSFEVATIRPHDADKSVVVAQTAGRFDASLTLKYMIQVAYDVAPYQVSGGPPWIDKEVWDITAKAEGFAGEIPLEQLRPMLRELIRDRFQLRVKAGKQVLPYFALVVDRKGPRLRQSTDGASEFHLERGPALSWKNVSMKSFASWLDPWIQQDRVVSDETGLPGGFDLQLRWKGQPLTPAPLSDPEGPTIFTALREQLGLRLESRRGPINTLVVEQAELPSGN